MYYSYNVSRKVYKKYTYFWIDIYDTIWPEKYNFNQKHDVIMVLASTYSSGVGS